MIITLGFTQSDRAHDYSSFADGYRLGARQVAVTVTVDDDGLDLAPEAWAEAVFVASNDPAPPPAGSTAPADRAVTAIRAALTEQVRFPLRSVSVGDTVSLAGQILACQPTGWQQVGDPPHGDDEPGGAEVGRSW